MGAGGVVDDSSVVGLPFDVVVPLLLSCAYGYATFFRFGGLVYLCLDRVVTGASR